MLALTATAPELRSWAVAVAQLGEWLQDGMDYTDLNGTDGEVQGLHRLHAPHVHRPDSPP